MATQKTNLYVNQQPTEATYLTVDSGGGVGVANSTLEVHGRVRTVFGTHLTTSALTAGTDYIALCKLPKNARVISAELIVPAAVGTTAGNLGVYTIGNDGTLTIVGSGNQISAAADAVTLATAGRKQLIAVQGRATYKTTTDVALAYMPTATNFATAITFDYIIQYVVD
jgi:hypothetical protein